MKMHGLRGENMMGMKHFDLSFDDKGNMIIVSGKNGEGKSSLINSFVLGLGGSKTDVAKLTTKPIREGASEAWVEVNLGEYVVRRVWRSNDKDTLSIIGKDGAKFGSPQKMLDKVIGDLSFDPLAFTRMKPKEQRELLLSIVELPIDLEAHDAAYAANFEKRREIGREVERLKGAWDSAMESATLAKVPDEEVKIIDLINRRDGLNETIQEVSTTVSLINELQEEEKALLVRIDAVRKRLSDERAALREYGDTSSLHDQVQELNVHISSAEQTNAAVRAKKERAVLKKQYEEQEARYKKGTQILAELDAQKADALDKAEMPVEGLSIDDHGVTFKGIPFGQLSMSQKIKVGAAIMFAQNPELKVGIINDGSLLDADQLKALASMADANDWQLLVEMVDDSGEIGIVIESGEVVSGDSTKKK